jgi:hypothetical protein
LTRGQRDARRALWATGGGVLGLAVGAGGAILILSNDNRPNSDVDAIGFLALSAIGETLGVAIGAAAAGGPGDGACRGDVRLLRSFAGTLAGTAAGALVFQHQQTAGVVLMPVSQIAGAVLSLGGC